jgi:hypothetical protein
MKRMKPFHTVGLVSLVILGLMSFNSQGPVARSHAPAIAQTRCVAPPPNMVSWWDGDSVSATIALDIQDGNDGTMSGVGIVPGKVGQAFSYGPGSTVNMGSPVNLQLQDFTIDAWIKENGIGVGGIAGYGFPGGYTFILLSGELVLTHNGFSSVGSGFVIADTNWHHVAVTKSGSNVVFYLDGVASTPKSYGPVFTFESTFFVGGGFNGLIDEVEIYDRALTDTEIQAIFNAGSAGKCKNTPPVATCQDVTVSAGPSCTANASINNGSFDPDGDPITLSQSPPGPYPLGVTEVTLMVTDDQGASGACTATVTVVDDTPPTVSSSVIQSTLWPPNHNLVNVGLSMSATDQCDTSLSINVTVFGDEDDEEPTGDGTHSPDAKDIAPGTLRLRSERKGDADGRVYLIVVNASDDAGNMGVACSTVVVPRSQSQADVNAVNAQAASARSFCLTNNGAPPSGYVVIGDGPIIGPKQ